MSIASEIARLQAAKVDIMAALVEKGVDVTGKNLVDVPYLIDSIEVQPEGAVIGGRTYRTVKISNQVWLAENLDFKANGISIAPSGMPSTPAAWYYNNDEATYGVNGSKYGLLYNGHAVKHLNDNRATLIPGWHVPSTAEWDALENAVGGANVAGSKLKSATGWGSGAGSDDFGFSAFPAGRWYFGAFKFVGSNGYFWTVPESSSTQVGFRFFSAGASINPDHAGISYGAYSVRLVKDA